jgi:hypothetical protein
MGCCAFFEQNDRLTFYKLKIGQDDNPVGTRRNGSHPLPSIGGHQISSSGMSRKVVRHIAFPPPIGIQLFPIGTLMQSMTAQFHFRKDVTQNFLDPVNVVVTEHPERKAEIKILIGKDRIAGIVADDMAFYPSIVLFWLKPSENPRRGSHTLVCS